MRARYVRLCIADEESPYDQPITFRPIRVIGRSQLPLIFLDTFPDDGVAPKRLFSTCIEILETPDDTQDKELGSRKVLIARNETNKMLYAIERVQPRIFSLCKLAGWLKEKDVDDLWDPLTLSLYPSFPKEEDKVLDDAEWWQHAAVKPEPEEGLVRHVKISMLRSKPETPELDRITPEQVQVALTRAAEKLDTAVPDVPEIAMEVSSPQQLLESLAQQYLDAVYLSKTSLAYFAKGPITRVRAAFTSPEEGAPPTYELVTFLRSMLLSHKAGENKYQEKLPEIVKSLPLGMFSDDEFATGQSKPKKSKKKIKLSRDGMYPHEQDIVKRWWISEMSNPEAHGEDTLDQLIKRRIGDLRVREALAQMILMLEIIALEALSKHKGPADTQATATGDAETQGNPQATNPKKRKKKLDDVGLCLDLLLDKLCIWQSVDQDGILDFDAKTSKQGDGMVKVGKAGSSDRLQGFCVEVIIPFYVSRLPEQAIMISKKLGGPVHTSPPKRKATKPPTTSRKSRESKEPDMKKSRRTLGRVATDTATRATQRSSTPQLNRSATDSALSDGIKRETSEVPLGAIPFQRSPSNAARQSMSHLKHLKGRQIDLSGPSAAIAAKLKQKQRVEEDLKEAITALKKPNRGLVAGSYVADIERRGLGSSKKSRKPAITVRKALKDVQVSATPRVVTRTKNMVDSTPRHHHDPFMRDHANDLPPSSDACIPSSGIRSIVPGTAQRMVTARNSAAPGIEETPIKGPNRKLFDTPGTCRRAIFATPARKSRAVSPPSNEVTTSPMAVFATPSKPISVPAPPKFTSRPAAVSTPTKTTVAATVSETPLLASSNIAKDEVEPSIYDALGWNDDDDL